MQRDNLDFLEQLLTSQFTISHLPITKEWTIIYYETADFCAFTCAFISTRISNMLNIQCKIFTLISSRDEAKVHSFSSILMNVKYKDVKMHESSQSIYYINTSYETSLGNERVDYFSRQEDQASSSALFFLESHETAEGRLYPTLSQVQREKSAARFMKCSKHVTERRSWQSAYSFIPLIILTVAALITLELVQLDNALAIKKKKKKYSFIRHCKARSSKRVYLEKPFSRGALFFPESVAYFYQRRVAKAAKLSATLLLQ